MARALPPLALYVHLPWCVRKCPYCDFNSHALKDELPEARYLAALLADLDADLAARPEARRELVSIFIGGGTPSLFAPRTIGALLEGIGARLPLAVAIEVTLEANPGTVEQGRFAGYRAAGVTRISLGVQSFDDGALDRLGRIHGGAEAERAIGEVVRAGFGTFNVDLMCALPGQDAAAACRDVERALALGASHLSHYELTLEPNTLFHARPPANLPDPDDAAAIQDAAHARLAAAGLARYEVSAWSRPGHRCQHNLNYWEFGDYLGIGAGAHGKLTDPDGAVWRTQKAKHPTRYLELAAQPAPLGTSTRTPTAELPFEFMLNALRLDEGFPTTRFAERTALDWGAIATRCASLADRGLLETDGVRWRATALGRRHLNDLLLEFLPSAEVA
jgi:oxygen-independent coproporphyrinogen-3 oxidase